VPEIIRTMTIRTMVRNPNHPLQRRKSRWDQAMCPRTFVSTMMTLIRIMELLPMAMVKMIKSAVMGTMKIMAAVVERVMERIMMMVEKQ